MKKILLLLLAMAMLLSLAACSENGQQSTEPVSTAGDPTEQTNQSVSGNATEGTEPAEEKWGVPDTYSAANENGGASFEICFPKLTGIPEGSGLIAYQDDHTRVIVDSELPGISPNVESVDEVLPAFFDQTIGILSTYYPPKYANYAFAIEKQEVVEINGYTMCKYVGNHSFTLSKEAMNYQFVAYATQLKANGAYIYWLVLDESPDQSLESLIESHALNMAKSLEEF